MGPSTANDGRIQVGKVLKKVFLENRPMVRLILLPIHSGLRSRSGVNEFEPEIVLANSLFHLVHQLNWGG
jgi:hypothetical protein